jgi:hypothetical protein
MAEKSKSKSKSKSEGSFTKFEKLRKAVAEIEAMGRNMPIRENITPDTKLEGLSKAESDKLKAMLSREARRQSGVQAAGKKSMSPEEANRILAKNLAEAKKGGFNADLSIKPIADFNPPSRPVPRPPQMATQRPTKISAEEMAKNTKTQNIDVKRAARSSGLGAAMAAMGVGAVSGGRELADEGFAGGMMAGGGRGGYKPAIRKRTAYSVLEE